jgi:endonuclease YncB( thermonuclease family)
VVTGYIKPEVAEARQRFRDLLAEIDRVYVILDRAKGAEQYHIDTSSFYTSARQELDAFAVDLSSYQSFIDTNKSKLDSYDYYALTVSDLNNQVFMLQQTIVNPTLVTPFSENPLSPDGPVGMSFTGKIKSVDDGDTCVVTQVVDNRLLDRVIRIAGIDAPEGGTSRGKAATDAAIKMWLGKDVTVFYDRHTPNDLYGRVLGTIYWQDVNWALWSLENCWSAPLTKFGKNHYLDPDELKNAAAKCIMGKWPPEGIIKVTSSPTHATVFIDGKEMEELTPCEVRLPVGEHAISLSVFGCSSVSDTIDVEPITKQLPPYILQKIESVNAVVSIVVLPLDVRHIISVDDKIIGISPITIELPVDISAKISAVSAEYGAIEKSVTPVSGIINKVELSPS